MILPAWSAALPVAVVVGLALFGHRKVRGFLPEDPPGKGRKNHPRPTPMAGAVPAIAALVILAWASWWWLVGGGLLMLGSGLVDDRLKEQGKGLDWRIKGGAMALAAGCAVLHYGLGEGLATGWWLWGLLFVFAITNAANFLDNTDGVTTALVGTGLLLASGGEGPWGAVAWAVLGFLLWNWPRPVVFLGDGGALVLGYLLAAQALTRAPIGREVVASCAVPAIDFTQVILARCVLGIKPWLGDRRHLTHLLRNRGVPVVLLAPFFALLAVLLYDGFASDASPP